MPDAPKPRPIVIPPLSKQTGLEVIRDRPQKKRAEHPHCNEHFLFTPHCAACLEAERTQAATAQATPISPKPNHKQKEKPKSSRSFGFTDNIPSTLFEDDSLGAQLVRQSQRDIEEDLIRTLFDI